MVKAEIDLAPLRRRIAAAWRRGEALAAEGNISDGRAQLERAHRLSGTDQNLALSLALLRLRDGDATGAALLFGKVARRHDVREAWIGLATASLLAGDAATAAVACASALRKHVPDPGLIAIAAAVVGASAALGWCGLAEDGAVLGSLPAHALTLSLDDAALPPGTSQLPPGWETAAWLHVSANGADLLGSPIDIRAITCVQGFVERTASGIRGWAWHPAAPETDPPLLVLDGAGRESARLVATDLGAESDGETPCARPRGFALDGCPSPVRVLGRDGRDLAGSPVAPWPERHCAPPATPKTSPAMGPADVVIPIFRGVDVTLACIDSVLETVPRGTKIWVVDDGSPERDLIDALQSIASTGRIALIPSAPEGQKRRNLGFPAAANAGLRAAGGRDVVLLNADTLVAPWWLMRLQRAAHSAADIGTATPVSNHASIFSVPDPAGGNPAPDLEGTRHMAALAARANAGVLVEVPTAHGFCMFIRADCLAETGLFRDDLFAQGYGEENDFCVRAQALGWRHVAVPSVYVAHVGGVSFGAARKHLLRRNLGLLGRLHPGYHASVAAWVEADPLFAARRRLDEARWRDLAARAPAHRGSVLLVTHDKGGGTARVVASRVADLRAQGPQPLLLTGRDGDCVLSDPESGTPTPNLRFRLPAEMPALLRLLAPWRPVAMEIHHLLGHDPSVRRLAARLGIPVDVWVHDYGFLCPRMTLTDGEGRYCGEPPAAACEACVREWGREDEQTIAPAALRAGAAADFAAARSVIVPSADVAARVRRHVPHVAPEIRPWSREVRSPPLTRPGPELRVAVVGAIGIPKGFSVILACAEDAAARGLNLSFAIVGYTIDDDALEATGHVRITGPFAADEAGSLIRAQGAGLAFIPSTWPETWCFALTDAWEAGLPACVFDIGTPAARVRATGFGWVLPLGLPAGRVNDRLLALSEGQGLDGCKPLPLVSRGTIR